MGQAQGDLILKARRKSGLSQLAFSRKLGFSSQFGGRIEKGEVNLPATKVKDLCKILDLKATDVCAAAASDYYDRYKSKAGLK